MTRHLSTSVGHQSSVCLEQTSESLLSPTRARSLCDPSESNGLSRYCLLAVVGFQKKGMVGSGYSGVKVSAVTRCQLHCHCVRCRRCEKLCEPPLPGCMKWSSLQVLIKGVQSVRAGPGRCHSATSYSCSHTAYDSCCCSVKGKVRVSQQMDWYEPVLSPTSRGLRH